MRARLVPCFALLAVSLLVSSGVAQMRYTIDLPEPQTQMVSITASFDLSNIKTDGELVVHLPVWRPGLYLVLDQAGTMRDIAATDEAGRALPIRKTAKSTWRVRQGDADTVHFSYRIYANSILNRTRHVDSTHAFLSGSSVFVYTEALRDDPVRVEIGDMPDGWRVATGLRRVGELAFECDNYDILVDSPLEIGVHDLIEFEVDGVPHEVAIWGRWDGNADRIVETFTALGEVQQRIFGEFPYDRYVYIIHSAEGLRGGTEHYNSTVCSTEPTMWDDDDRWDRFLSLIAHELFHVWNVKRFRPAGIARYDYLRENYTELLWVAEGTTSYYDELSLPRAGILTGDEFLEWLGRNIDAHMNQPGRHIESLEDSSFDAWIKLFHRGADRTPDRHNQGESFYRKGALVSMMLDLEIRRRSGGAHSLDDVMRTLYERFPLGSEGFRTSDIAGVIAEFAGGPMDGFFDEYVAGVTPIEGRLGELLNDVGLRLVTPDEAAEGETEAFTGISASGDGTVRRIRSDGPAYDAGLLAGDQIIAVNTLRGRDDTNTRLDALEPGQDVSLWVMRRDELHEVAFVAGTRPAGDWEVRPVDEPSPAQEAAFRAWTDVPLPVP